MGKVFAVILHIQLSVSQREIMLLKS